MMSRYGVIIGIVFFIFLNGAFSQRNEVVVRPVEIDSVLLNPGIGFTTFQKFNGDPGNILEGCCGDFKSDYPSKILKDKQGNLENKNYPLTTIAYIRFYWQSIEPEEGLYRWDIIDRALSIARQRGQTLMLSVMPYGTEGRNDVPVWYRKMVGNKTDWKHNNPVNKWLVDPEDPRYAFYYNRMIQSFGEKYDGHPDLESVDVRIVGAWGEGGGSALLSQDTREKLVGAYLGSFKKTPLVMLLTDEKTNRYGISQANVGWRVDCLGDLGFWADEQNGWTHMYDYYPQGIINFGMQDAWKKAPVTFEVCGIFNTWKKSEKYSQEDVKYIFDQALKWHVSSFNAKSSNVPDEYWPAVNEFMKKMGYRFVLRQFSYPKTVKQNSKIYFKSWWENKGVAPCYKNFPLAIRLKNDQYEKIFFTDADIKTWLPGDIIYDDAIFIPLDMPTGIYELQIGIIDPAHQRPKVKLAIDGRRNDGWYALGKAEIIP